MTGVRARYRDPARCFSQRYFQVAPCLDFLQATLPRRALVILALEKESTLPHLSVTRTIVDNQRGVARHLDWCTLDELLQPDVQ